MKRNKTPPQHKRSQKNLADQRGISRQAVHKNRRIAKSADGQIDVKTTLAIRDALLRKERALAHLRELEYQTLSGQVVSVVAVEHIFAQASKSLTDQALSLPSRLAPLIAALDDENQIHALLSGGLREALTNLQVDLRAALATER